MPKINRFNTRCKLALDERYQVGFEVGLQLLDNLPINRDGGQESIQYIGFIRIAKIQDSLPNVAPVDYLNLQQIQFVNQAFLGL